MATVLRKIGNDNGLWWFVIRALAAQDQAAQAGEAQEKRTNCALSTHRSYQYAHRQKKCNTFPIKSCNYGSSGFRTLW
jgi:hypothetical protein